MSVVKSKRGEGQLLVITKAYDEQVDTYSLMNKMYEYYQELWR